MPRASIQMTYSAFGPTVPLKEAQKIEKETADYLLNSRKLSLIVDLDQTAIHATLDSTVGEWIAEDEAWKEKKVMKMKPPERAEEGEDVSDEIASESEMA
ncbi:hypothetical protein SERLADRAFT_441999 [Serpula lacrymans var. lacrymans S7.9]|nr:uncharacterized protein SERLADRAFT_441999 [Serpula lacrymans var. lacrymans S7.9]EGO20661.1 hypothetical protein SERLADRAFT_441999 [Serpula lacrymans var. lacrymans S7.9]